MATVETVLEARVEMNFDQTEAEHRYLKHLLHREIAGDPVHGEVELRWIIYTTPSGALQSISSCQIVRKT